MTRARSLSRLANTNAFTVDSNQRVGIGSTQPDVRLDVNGDMNVTGTLTYEDVTNVETAGITTTGGLVVTGLGATIGGITTFFGDLNFGAAGVGGTITPLGHGGFTGIVTALGFQASGVITATSFRGDGSELSGVDSSNLIDSGSTNRVAANTSGIVVTGIATVTGDVSIADKIIHTGDTNTAIRFPAADTFTVETAGSERLRIDSSGRVLQGLTSAKFGFFNNSNAPPVFQIQGSTYYDSALSIFRDGVGASGPNFILAAGREAIVQDNDSLGTISFQGHDGTTELIEGASIVTEVDGTPAANNVPSALVFKTNSGTSSTSERLRITSRGGFQFSNGFMSETVKINTSARTGTQAVNLDDGMVHYFSTNSAGTWKPNFTMSAGDDINATIATGDVFSPTMIVAKGATSHYATTIQVDGSDVTPEFSGGAPSDGGGSGTFDVYNYTIIKTGDDTFKAFAAVSTYE
tara:strand:- start:70 stop:1464 length:1395 start_codon:yes stop_codon:yes gene_type:complete